MNNIQPVISNELQFGNHINAAVASQQGSDFRLLLSMLSEDVMDQVQFQHLQKPSQPMDKLAGLPLPPEQPFMLQSDSLAAQGKLSQQLHQSGMDDVRLLVAMQPDALSLTGKQDQQLASDVAGILHPVKRFKLAGGELAHAPETWQQADLALMAMLDTLNTTSPLNAA